MGRARQAMGGLEWALAAVAALIAASLGVTPATVSATFRGMFREFGSFEELSPLTQLVLSGWYGPAVASAVALLLVLTVALGRGRRLRLLLLALALVLGLSGLGVYLFGVYLPIFEVAEAVGP